MGNSEIQEVIDPHVGIGREAFGKILDLYPDAYTAIVFMLPDI